MQESIEKVHIFSDLHFVTFAPNVHEINRFHPQRKVKFSYFVLDLLTLMEVKGHVTLRWKCPKDTFIT